MARIEKVMLTDVPKLQKEAKIGEAAKLLVKNQSGCVVVVENNKLIGIITELDFVKNLASKGKSFKDSVGKVMSSPVAFMTPDMKLDEALKLIDTKKFRRYPVTRNGELIGLATKRDVVNAISDNLRFHRNIQNIVLVLFVLFELFVFVLYKYLPFGI